MKTVPMHQRIKQTCTLKVGYKSTHYLLIHQVIPRASFFHCTIWHGKGRRLCPAASEKGGRKLYSSAVPKTQSPGLRKQEDQLQNNSCWKKWPILSHTKLIMAKSPEKSKRTQLNIEHQPKETRATTASEESRFAI